MSTPCCCFFLSKHFTFLCLQQSFYWEQRKSFIRIMVLSVMLNQSNFQISSKFAKQHGLKIPTSASHSKCEMLPALLGSWSICCPQATSICLLPQWAHIALCGLIQFQWQIVRFRHYWENMWEFQKFLQHIPARLSLNLTSTCALGQSVTMSGHITLYYTSAKVC